MTDNRSCYTSKVFGDLCTDLDIRHIRTRPYTMITNGKTERFIQTALREWAYAAAYQTSTQRYDPLPVWLHRYNWNQPHSSLKKQTPTSRLCLDENNLLNFDTRHCHAGHPAMQSQAEWLHRAVPVHLM